MLSRYKHPFFYSKNLCDDLCSIKEYPVSINVIRINPVFWGESRNNTIFPGWLRKFAKLKVIKFLHPD